MKYREIYGKKQIFLSHLTRKPVKVLSSRSKKNSYKRQTRNILVQGRIQSKPEGGAVGNRGADKFSKIGDESTHIQQFEVHFRNKQHSFEVILVTN